MRVMTGSRKKEKNDRGIILACASVITSAASYNLEKFNSLMSINFYMQLIKPREIVQDASKKLGKNQHNRQNLGMKIF